MSMIVNKMGNSKSAKKYKGGFEQIKAAGE